MAYAIKRRSIPSGKYKENYEDPLVAVSDKYLVEVIYQCRAGDLDSYKPIDIGVTDLINNMNIFNETVGDYREARITRPFIGDDIAVFQIYIDARTLITYLVDINEQSISEIDVDGEIVGLFNEIIYYTDGDILKLYNLIDKTISDYGDIYLNTNLYKLGNDLVYTATDYVDENGDYVDENEDYIDRVPYYHLRHMIYIINLQSNRIIYEMEGKGEVIDIVGNKIIYENNNIYYILDFNGNTEVINFIGGDDEIIINEKIVATHAGENYISIWTIKEPEYNYIRNTREKYKAYLTEFVLNFNNMKSANSLISVM